MHRRIGRFRAAVLALTVAGLAGAGCRTARMAMDGTLRTQAEEWPVEGRGRIGYRARLAFGPYQATEIQHGRRRTAAWHSYDDAYRSADARQSYSFRLSDGTGASIEANGSTRVRWQDLRGGFRGGTFTYELDSDTVFAFSFDREGAPTWFLAMSQGGGDIVLNGTLVSEERRLRVRGTQKLEGTTMPLLAPAGYTFYDGERPVAAVEVINRGAVWFAPDMDAELRAPVAAAASALLLYRELN